MTDEATADKPLVHAEATIDRPIVAQDPPETISLEPGSIPPGTAPPTKSAHVRLREFEDHLFGEDCVRIAGRIERGYGSKFKEMTAPQSAHYAALEKLVAAEQRLEDSRTAQADAETAAWAAHDLATKTEAEIDGPVPE